MIPYCHSIRKDFRSESQPTPWTLTRGEGNLHHLAILKVTAGLEDAPLGPLCGSSLVLIASEVGSPSVTRGPLCSEQVPLPTRGSNAFLDEDWPMCRALQGNGRCKT
jgi:hypothetical protein